MQALAPVIGCWLPVLSGQESINTVRIFSGSLAGGSVCIMCLGTHSAVSNERYAAGVLVLILEQVWLVMSAVLSKNLLSQFSPVALTAYSSAWGTGFSILELSVVRTTLDSSLNLGTLRSRSMAISLAYSTLLVSCLGYSLKTVSMRKLPASTVMAYSALQPVVAIAMARVLLNEEITLPASVGVVGVCVALFILSRYDNVPPKSSKGIPEDKLNA
jgi:drug/metabolite transporter (DMT)-like permease